MAVSGVCAATIGFTHGGAPLATLAVALVWGVSVVADSAQFSTAVTELSPPAYVGTALTTQTCVGFALTTISIWLLPPIVGAVGWRWAFATLAVGPLLGVVAMARLRAAPESLALAAGLLTPAAARVLNGAGLDQLSPDRAETLLSTATQALTVPA